MFAICRGHKIEKAHSRHSLLHKNNQPFQPGSFSNRDNRPAHSTCASRAEGTPGKRRQSGRAGSHGQVRMGTAPQLPPNASPGTSSALAIQHQSTPRSWSAGERPGRDKHTARGETAAFPSIFLVNQGVIFPWN